MPKPHSAAGVKKLLVWGKKEKLTMPSEQASRVPNAETSKALKEDFADYPAAEEYLGPRTSGKDAGADRSKANPAGHSLEWSDLPYVPSNAVHNASHFSWSPTGYDRVIRNL
jgi:hypothetical protein